jgi:hypothetical protein
MLPFRLYESSKGKRQKGKKNGIASQQFQPTNVRYNIKENIT